MIGKPSRRDFFATAAAAAAMMKATATAQSMPIGEKTGRTDRHSAIRLGLASYTLRNFDLDSTIKMCKRLKLEHICLKSMHLPMNLPPDQLALTAQKVRDAGLNLYACGVIYMKTASEVEKAFEYAKNAGVGMIIGAPALDLLDITEENIKKYNIKLAIHNHGPDNKLYPSPLSAYEVIQNRDKRFGLCVDIGHTQRLGLNPADEIKKLADRVLDLHIKDVTESTEKGIPVEIGHGVIDIPAVLRTLLQIEYSGVASFEFEKDGDDPLPGLAESLGYVRGAMAALQDHK